MSSVKSVTVYSQQGLPDGRYEVRYTVILTDELAIDHEFVIGPYRVTDINAEGAVHASSLLREKEDSEVDNAFYACIDSYISPEKVSQWNAQADYDRRVLVRTMTITDVNQFLAAYPLWIGQQDRGSPNDNSRATRLKMLRADYLLMKDRFSSASGVQWFADLMISTLWSSIPTGYE